MLKNCNRNICMNWLSWNMVVFWVVNFECILKYENLIFIFSDLGWFRMIIKVVLLGIREWSLLFLGEIDICVWELFFYFVIKNFENKYFLWWIILDECL